MVRPTGSINAPPPESGDRPDIPPAPTGLQQAVICMVEDLGWHDKSYKGEVKRKHLLVIGFELEAKIEGTGSEADGKRYMLSNTYTLSMHEKANLRKDVGSLRGSPLTDADAAVYDLAKLYGMNCTVNVMQKPRRDNPAKMFSYIDSLAPPMSGFKSWEPELDKLPRWVEEMKAGGGKEPGPAKTPSADAGGGFDEVPFNYD